MRSLFGSELRRAREAAGLSREQLAEEINFSASQIEKVEVGTKSPSEQFAQAADEALEADGLLQRIRRNVLTEAATPDWVRQWFGLEQQASRLLAFELSLVPGLLQTEEYARALLGGDEAKLAVRMERQVVLGKLTLIAVIDERALRYPVGGRDVMARQVEQLIEQSDRMVIQVLPAECGTYRHLSGPFRIATVDGRDVAYADSPASGVVMSDPEVVSRLKDRLGSDPGRGSAQAAVDRVHARGSTSMADLDWRTSSRSTQEGGDCVEVALTANTALVRDSKNCDGGVLRMSPEVWTAFVAFAKEQPDD